MIYWRCQCGKAEMWEAGMSPKPCQGCRECNTTYAFGPSGHHPIEPHEWEPRFHPHTGKPDGGVCIKCHKRDKDWEHQPTREGKDVCTRVHRKRKLDL